MLIEARLRAKAGWPTWCYYNEYYNPKQYPDWVPFMCIYIFYVILNKSPFSGCTHANEYPYMNGLFPVGEFEFNSNDFSHSLYLVEMIVNFAKYGYFF